MKKKFLVGLAIWFFMLGVGRMAGATTIVSEGLGSSAYTASSSWNSTPDLAFDGNFGISWNSGTWPVGWIEVNLGELTDITEMLLSVAQYPLIADTTHQIWTSYSSIQADTSNATLSHTFSGQTFSTQLLSVVFSTPVTAQFVQVRTTRSPSWVSWTEIQVMAASPAPEPSTIILLGFGLVGLAGVARKKMKR